MTKSEIARHIWLGEPKLSFHPDRSTDLDEHPLRGLLRFGPYSKNLVPDPIRVATLAPQGESAKLYGFMRELNSEFEPTERKEYLPKWPGFHNVFSVRMRGRAARVMPNSMTSSNENLPLPLRRTSFWLRA